MAVAGNKSLKGIVYRLTPVKEKDAMVSCFGEEGLFSFYAYGVMNPSASNYGACQVSSESEFFLVESTQRTYRLKEAKLLDSYHPEDDLSAMLGLSFLIELVSRFLAEEDAAPLFPYFKQSLIALKEGKGAKTVCTIFLSHLMSVSGYGLNLDECVLCGKKSDIVSVSNIQGGYLCRSCAEEEGDAKMDVATLKAYRIIAKTPSDKIGSFELELKTINPILSNLSHLLEESTGAKIKSLQTLLSY